MHSTWSPDKSGEPFCGYYCCYYDPDNPKKKQVNPCWLGHKCVRRHMHGKLPSGFNADTARALRKKRAPPRHPSLPCHLLTRSHPTGLQYA